MRSVVIYESMFGSTRKVAEAVAEGLAPCSQVSVVSVTEAVPADVDGVDLVVVGAPTHVHGMPRASTRKGAREMAEKPDSMIELLPGADVGPGVREWLESLGQLEIASAAFDTRLKGPSVVTGRASKTIGRLLARHGAKSAAPAESFLVDKRGTLLEGELGRARSWGEHLTWSDCLRRVVEQRSTTASTT
jgi:Flavodoxin domain